MSKFSGHYDINMDDKTRVFIPAKLRDAFNGKAIVCRPLNGMRSIFIYPEPEWDAFIERSMKEYEGIELVSFKTMINANMNEVKVDDHGRLNVGQEFAKYAELERNVVLVCADSHLQLWNKKILDEDFPSTVPNFDPKKLAY